ncbi:DUF883 family protein [Candidatus Williamhamiltonella defendens]|uniref:DUF883 family protein n=1 Tax=Candidatus Williamhamiltonella defendens TaxID=138072 RepID=UPI00130EF623|nr:YqjD family protein [Candidatus Hamiltonella defensa]
MSKNDTTENLRKELNTMANTLEEVLSSSDKPKVKLKKIRSKAENILKSTRDQLSETGKKMMDKTKELKDKADTYIHDNPWTGVAIGVAAGLVLGILLSHR